MMTDSSITLLIPAAMTLIAALAIMHVFGCLVRNETNLHDLRRRVKELQYGQAIKMAKIKGMIPDEPPAQSGIELPDDTAISAEEIESDVEIVQPEPLSDESTPANAA